MYTLSVSVNSRLGFPLLSEEEGWKGVGLNSTFFFAPYSPLTFLYRSGIFLRDILYIEEANKDKKADSTVNLPKILLLGDILLAISSFQSLPYPWDLDTQLLAGLFAGGVWSEEESYQRSLVIEPRGGNALEEKPGGGKIRVEPKKDRVALSFPSGKRRLGIL